MTWFLVLVAAVAAWAVWTYNRLIALRNQVQNAWKQIDVQLKRRHDLIPNLVAAVKGAMELERDTLERYYHRAAENGELEDKLERYARPQKFV